MVRASVAKLVDAVDSKSTAFTGVPVQVRPLVPLETEHSKHCLLTLIRLSQALHATPFASLSSQFSIYA